MLLTGAGRSGGTIIGNILGEIPGVVSIGELYQLYNDGLLQSELCGCGKQVKQCEFWGPILSQILGKLGKDDFDHLRSLRDNLVRSRNSLLMTNPVYRNKTHSALHKYIDIQEQLYQAIQEQTNCELIVDTSRIPSYGWLLTQMTSVDPFIVQIVRDPRAVAYSWLKHRSRPIAHGHAQGVQQPPPISALTWDIQNMATELLARFVGRDKSMRLSYEDFTQTPVSILQALSKQVGLSACFDTEMINAQSNSLYLNKHHTLAGNSSRFKTGYIQLRTDLDWQAKLSIHSRWIVTILSWPLLLRYGYGIIP